MPDTRLYIEPERIDELPLALGLLHHMGVPQIVDAHLGSGHGNRQGLSYGQLAQGSARASLPPRIIGWWRSKPGARNISAC